MKLKLVYDVQGRVISEDSTGGRGMTSISYDQSSSTITNSSGGGNQLLLAKLVEIKKLLSVSMVLLRLIAQ